MALPAVFCLRILRLFVTSITAPARAAELAVVAPLDKILNSKLPRILYEKISV